MAYLIVSYYHEYYGLFVYNGIIFNDESPLRDKKYVLSKIYHIFRDIINNDEFILIILNI
jgi:GDP-D-mannose dehydratase